MPTFTLTTPTTIQLLLSWVQTVLPADGGEEIDAVVDTTTSSITVTYAAPVTPVV